MVLRLTTTARVDDRSPVSFSDSLLAPPNSVLFGQIDQILFRQNFANAIRGRTIWANGSDLAAPEFC